MLLPKFEFHEPETVEEACRILGELGEKAKTLAGGTDLLVNMKKKLLAPEHVVSLDRIASLGEIEASNGTLKIGACAKAADIAESEAVIKDFPALQTAASKLGSPLIRNLATVGGNLVSSRPAADFPPPLMAYGATVVLTSGSGRRSVALWDFIKAPGETLLSPEEILEAVVVEKPEDYSGSAYFKLGIREALEISLVNIAVSITLDGPEGAIKAANVVMGSVGPTPLLSPAAEKVLLGEKPSEALFVKAGDAAATDSKPIDDFRAGADYKRAMVKELTKRALLKAFDGIGKA